MAKKYLIRRIMDYIGVALLAALLLLIWQLYKAPIALPFLKPYIIAALNHESSEYTVTVDEVNLELVRSIQPIKIIANQVIYKKNDDSIIINAPRTSVSFSIKAILRGIIAPSSIEIAGPTVYFFTSYGVDKTEDKIATTEEIQQKKIEFYFDSFDRFIERFNSPDKTYPESYINEILIKNAEVEFHEIELGRKWILSDVNYYFERNYSNIETGANALMKLNNSIVSMGIDAQYRPNTKKIALTTYFNDLVTAELVDTFLMPTDPNNLYQINLPLDGKVDALIDFGEVMRNRSDIMKSLDTAVENVKFKFEGGQGNIMFSDKEEYKYNVSSFMLEGNLDSGLNEMKIENANFDLGDKNAVLNLNVKGMKKYLLYNSPEDLKITAKADIKEMKFDDLFAYWPRYIGSLAWDWCKESIYGGDIKNASFTFDFSYSAKDKSIRFDNLTGIGSITDSNLNYLTGMPHVKNVYGTAHFQNGDINIDIDKGISNGVILKGGYVRLYDLDKYDNFAEIKLLGDSSATDALYLIDNEPLGYATEMGLKPDNLQGTADIDAYLNFELKQNLTPEEVKVEVNAVIKDVVMPKVIADKDLHAEELTLHVDNSGMKVEGKSLIDDIPIDLLWTEDFNAKKYKTKYQLSFLLDDEIKKKLGLDFALLNAPYIEGTAEVTADIIIKSDKKTEIEITADMKNTEIDYSFIGFYKDPNEKAIVKTKLDILNDKIVSVSNFELINSELQIKGKIDLNDKGEMKKIDIAEITGPKTKAEASIVFPPSEKDNLKVNITGSSYDLTEFFTKREKRIKEVMDKENNETDNDSFEDVPNSEIFISVNRLWTNEHVSINNFFGSATLVNGVGINEMHLVGNYGTHKDVILKLDYTPRPDGEFILAIDSNNAGATLKVLRIYDHMDGGHLLIEAKRNVNKEFIGHARIRDFSIYNTPMLAKLLTVASFSSMVRMLTGEGLAFSHFDAPFEYKKQTLHINEAKAFGNVLGITASGFYAKPHETVDIRGVVAPAYNLNTLIGNIPIIGGLLQGKDGTVFAANYSMKGNINDPVIDMNTLSALSPSSLKDLAKSIWGDEDVEQPK